VEVLKIHCIWHSEPSGEESASRDGHTAENTHSFFGIAAVACALYRRPSQTQPTKANMAELIFATRNNTKTQVSWHIGQHGGLQSGGDQAGICSAMSAVWVSKSIRKGSPLSDRSELGTQHNNAIVMGARMVGGHDRRWILEAQGLSIGKETLGAPTVPFILLNEMKKYNGYTYFSTGGSGGRHAMAVGIVNGDNYFFDPNFGMYKLGKVEFISFIGNHLTSVYADLLDDFATYNVA
jgi:hypothetical protein